MKDYAQEYMENNFFSPERERKEVARDLFGYPVLEEDEVFIYQDKYLLISRMKKTQIEMAKAMKLEKRVMQLKELSQIQAKLNAPKSQYNSFGKYSYRNAEDILAAVKPFEEELNVDLTLSDDIVVVGDRIYVKATATLTNDKGEMRQTTAFAREPQTKKGMDDSQVTGASSSYARKYALNGLFAIDDTKDADSMDNRQSVGTNKTTATTKAKDPLNSTFGAISKQYQQQNSVTEQEMYARINEVSKNKIENFFDFNKLDSTAKQGVINWLKRGVK